MSSDNPQLLFTSDSINSDNNNDIGIMNDYVYIESLESLSVYNQEICQNPYHLLSDIHHNYIYNNNDDEDDESALYPNCCAIHQISQMFQLNRNYVILIKSMIPSTLSAFWVNSHLIYYPIIMSLTMKTIMMKYVYSISCANKRTIFDGRLTYLIVLLFFDKIVCMT